MDTAKQFLEFLRTKHISREREKKKDNEIFLYTHAKLVMNNYVTVMLLCHIATVVKKSEKIKIWENSAESEEKAASLLFSRITPARVDEHVPIHYVRLILSIY